jgi:tetratricopeptide (TPR) repeat protein
VKHIIEPLPLPRAVNPELPEAVERVILKALAKDPQDRFSNANEMADAFTAAVAMPSSQALSQGTPPLQGAPRGEAKGSRPAGEAPRVKAAAETRPLRSRKLIWGAAALVVIGIGAVALGSRLTSPSGTLSVGTPSAPSLEPARTVDQLLADAQARLNQGDLDAAITDFREATAADPSNLDLLWSIASTLKDSGQLDSAKTFADEAVAAGPDDPSFHDSAGWFYYELGYYAEAVASFKQILELDPESLWAYVSIADALLAMGDADQARLALDNAVQQPVVPDPDLYKNVAYRYSQLEAWPEAQAAFRLALNQDPATIEAWDGLTDATYNAEGLEAAWLVAQEALAANPEAPALHENAGGLAAERGDLAAAEGEYQQAIAVDPSYVSAYIGLAQFYSDSGRSTESLATLESGIAANPEDSWLQQTLGQTLLDQGDAEGAYAHFHAALQLDPESGWTALQAASAYYQFSADVQGTGDLLERAGALGTNDPYLLDNIGQAYEGMGDCAHAAEYYRRTLDLDPSIENSQAGLTCCQG